jgi:hypothetical protein
VREGFLTDPIETKPGDPAKRFKNVRLTLFWILDVVFWLYHYIFPFPRNLRLAYFALFMQIKDKKKTLARLLRTISIIFIFIV